ncbi:regulator [Cyclobacterium sp. 1_MG-2023]|uniref:ligand-binding sensor domain-containing protein n=1 Tax=Cyclobacterium sp. 1_MG-2023 TaxID=3062681 RepID=UPI0026E2FB4D|nr:regulator [Cyclobacterium sp. 1_MG-2023]MDO6436342.1 regulator [Cyclobacterium sp. 1_MG-2023]
MNTIIKINTLSLLMAFMAMGCGKSTEADITKEGQSASHTDTAFVQEYHKGFVVHKDMPAANDVRAIHLAPDQNVWIATGHGVYRKPKTGADWEQMLPEENVGPAYDLDSEASGKVWLASWDGVYALENDALVQVPGPKPPIAKVLSTAEGVYAFGPYGIWLYSENEWKSKDFTNARSIRTVLTDKNAGLWLGTDIGLYHCNEEQTSAYQKNEDLISAYVKGLDFDDEGNLWVGGLGGVTIRKGDKVIDKKEPSNGITNVNVNVVKKAPDGKMWVGTDYGITRFQPGENDYSVRLSKRWLRADEVRDIDFDANGNAWVATSDGVSLIGRKEMTLAEKADYFYGQLISRHVREPGIVARFKLEVPGDTSSIVPDDDDNDGEYTAMYLAMESFRYAVTGSEEAKVRAKKAFDFLHLLREVTGREGFFARTVVPVDWDRPMHDMNRTYTDRELAEAIVNNPRTKPVEVRWHPSEDGKWLWKGDTSSDEFAGHFFGYYWYYFLVADEAEKQRIAAHVEQIMDHLLRNDFYLVGVDGKPAKWGVWSPKSLNDDPEWSPEKPLNSLEILSFLKFAHAITGKAAYQEAYIKLIKEEGYLENAKQLYTTNPAFETYFDIYMALYTYPALINLEEDAELKAEYRKHLDQWFAKFKDTRSPLLNLTYNLLTGGADELEASIFFLQDAPLSLVDWRIDNGKREDLQLVRSPILEEIQVNELRPPSEYRTMRWDNNPYLAVSGNPSEEKEPVYWLLPYWMGKYQGLIK